MPPKKILTAQGSRRTLRLPELWAGKARGAISGGTLGDLLLKQLHKGGASKLNLAEDDTPDWLKPKALIKPDDQEDVPEADLDEDVGRILTTTNPQWATTEVAFNYGKGVFLPVTKVKTGRAYILYNYQGTAIRKDGEEAKAQIAAGYGMANFDDAGPKRAKAKKAADEEEEEEEEAEAPPAEPEKVEEVVEEEQEKLEGEQLPEGEAPPPLPTEELAGGDENEDEGEEAEAPPEAEAETIEEEAIVIVPRVKKLANQFNFCERAALTYNYPVRSVDTQTVPPPRADYGNTALQSVIYDYYQEDYARKMREKEDEKPKRLRKKTGGGKQKTAQELHDEALTQRIRESWAILERLVNQNIYDDIAQDYRYWEDPSDEFREGLGSLLPLWRFMYDPMRSHSVCDVMWNPHYHDLFAVAYGSLDFTAPQKEGCLCLYSLKNPAYPEYAVIVESPVTCLDIHKDTPYLICIGRLDGNVCVYNTQLTLDTNYQYKSDSVAAKHSTVVWEVKWAGKLLDGENTFFSISGDGRVVQWAVMPNELKATTIITLNAPVSPLPGPDGTLITVNSCGSCICFHPKNHDIFMVGTEDGAIHTCSRSYNRDYVRSMNAHHMPVYRIHYNFYNSSVFISCSGDWRVKIWEDGRSEPLFMFELGSAVGDVKWAPYSSTVFAACTTEGKVYVFDLNVNKYRPICSQNVVSKKNKRLTRIDFNHKLPVIVCGDTKGGCHVLKLSPNLRVMCKPPKKQQNLDQRTLQVMKLDKLLSLVRDPPITAGVIEEKFEDD